ncbi:stage V sporulation protein D (sporulation-specific penicillin-binding protein) [Oscillibacter sp. PC13]|uniref:penicillin-binding transpeptidase domain-containing protein n=1 Tax=Oscillibacter sp. PC13 TaxID=1855299 RepID=UPI0008E041FB|nr:penicillin-binding transpeptidase domain-containing protein [Oscillibacter sp. PC13]SFP21371.1 stage V sporulation protein D (sporulation-specific penicillin-binding protein) [Oscillibacter sp. PC13]
MAKTPGRKSDAARRANQVIRGRTVLMMVLLGVVTFLLLFWKLYDLQINQHEELQEKAVKQQTRSTVVTASRGTIYDRNGNTLAISATAETVFVSPKEISDHAKEQDSNYIARGLSRILEVDQDSILKKMEKTQSQYEIVKLRTDQEVADEVRRFINGEIDDAGNALTTVNEEGDTVLIADPTKGPTKLRGIYMEPDSKRYYPYGTLASNVIGFVGTENSGLMGLEAKYDDVLQGTAGLTVTAKNAAGSDLLYQYEQYYDAENGHNLVLTLDTNVQYYLEKGLKSMLDKFGAANGGTGIVMNPKNGAILAMATYPNYDLQNPSEIYDTDLQAALQGLEEGSDAYKSALGTAQQTQWRNKCIDSTYEPGSTFKPITLATALEEGVVNMNTTFTCTGSIRVPGWYKAIGCAKKAGHGTQTLKVATGNSCNPAFITMGLKIGTQTYYKYLKSFGLMEKTGVDMIGETSGIFADEKSFNSNVVSLASYAFGQTFNVTPLALIRAQAATINGGYLYTPYIVDQVLDDNGNILEQHDATPVRQVVSEETSALVRECLEWVVSDGGGKNGQVTGYRVGGKTGTADKTGTRDVVVSFMCFAPADDPQVIMLLTMDTPSRNTGTPVFGGTMVAPVASRIMSEVLPWLGIDPDYTAEELVGADTTVPNVVGKSLEDAKTRLTSAGFAYKTVGEGSTVTDQTPVGGAIVPNNASIILYLGAEKSDALCTVPNVVGLSAAQANTAMTNAGLIMKVAGATTSSSGNVHAISQVTAAGTEVEAGTVVTVQFGDNSVLD